jgi:hypothetical protein
MKTLVLLGQLAQAVAPVHGSIVQQQDHRPPQMT